MRKFWLQEEHDLFEKCWNNPKILKEDLLKIFVDRTWSALERYAGKQGYLNYTTIRKAKINRDYLKKLLRVINVE